MGWIFVTSAGSCHPWCALLFRAGSRFSVVLGSQRRGVGPTRVMSSGWPCPPPCR